MPEKPIAFLAVDRRHTPYEYLVMLEDLYTPEQWTAALRQYADDFHYRHARSGPSDTRAAQLTAYLGQF